MKNRESTYEVIVSNIGQVYHGHNFQEAHANLGIYVRASKSGHGRAAGEDVSFWRDGEPVMEFMGALNEAHVFDASLAN